MFVFFRVWLFLGPLLAPRVVLARGLMLFVGGVRGGRVVYCIGVAEVCVRRGVAPGLPGGGAQWVGVLQWAAVEHISGVLFSVLGLGGCG